MRRQELDLLIDELERLETEAKEGPWKWACDFGIGKVNHWNVHRAEQPDEAVCLGLVSMATEDWSLDHYPTPDMQLLVTSRNAVPALIAEIRRLRAEKGEG